MPSATYAIAIILCTATLGLAAMLWSVRGSAPGTRRVVVTTIAVAWALVAAGGMAWVFMSPTYYALMSQTGWLFVGVLFAIRARRFKRRLRKPGAGAAVGRLDSRPPKEAEDVLGERDVAPDDVLATLVVDLSADGRYADGRVIATREKVLLLEKLDGAEVGTPRERSGRPGPEVETPRERSGRPGPEVGTP
ncbi:MAG: hypothetical protein ACYS9X_30680, partial [Planctomycetota bacterium]